MTTVGGLLNEVSQTEEEHTLENEPCGVCRTCGRGVIMQSIYHRPSTRVVRYNIEQGVESEEGE